LNDHHLLEEDEDSAVSASSFSFSPSFQTPDKLNHHLTSNSTIVDASSAHLDESNDGLTSPAVLEALQAFEQMTINNLPLFEHFLVIGAPIEVNPFLFV